MAAIEGTLLKMLGGIVGKKLIDNLLDKPNGAQKLERASEAVAKGLGAIDALKRTFGDGFTATLNDAMGMPAKARFSYAAGTNSYVRADANPSTPPLAVLLDELHINLDRIALTDTGKAALKNHLRGAFHVWKGRLQELAPDHYAQDAKATLEAIDGLLDDSGKSAPEVYRSLAATGVGTIGALLIASGFSLITGTGVGVLMAIWIFFMGIPWLHAGAHIVLGLLLIVLIIKLVRRDNSMSTAIQLAYGLLDRCAKAQ